MSRAQQLQALPNPNERRLGWRSAVQGEIDPFYLQESDLLFRMSRLPEMEALYVQFRSHRGTDAQPIEPFVDRVEAEIRTNAPKNMIVDLRHDSGGNADHTIETMRLIGDSVKGRIYILIGPYTFSAGIVTAAVLKCSAGARAVLVGEEVGDRLRWWSEGRNVRLPNSGYRLHVSDGLWDLVNGCAEDEHCYGDRFGAKVGSLTPDLPAGITARSWMAGEDPGLEAISLDLKGLRDRALRNADANDH
jgi:hypothetical protein